MRLRRTRPLLLLLAAAMIAAACSTAQPADGVTIEVFGPYRGEDARNFAASLLPFEEKTGYDVLYIGTGTLSKDIQARVDVADYPDIAIFPQPALIRQFAEAGLLVPLEEEEEEEEETTASPAMTTTDDILAGTVGDTRYAVWLRAVVKSLVWYPPDVFDERGYAVPGSWEEMMSLSELMRADGTSPWCLSMASFGATGWVGTDWIEDIILRTQGPDYYDRWVAGDVTFQDPGVLDAFGTFGDIVHTPKNVFGGVHRILNEPWQSAQDPMFAPDPGCLLHRQASFQTSNLPPDTVIGEDTDVFLLPAMGEEKPPVLVSGELAAAFSASPEVMELMQYLESPEAGKEWAARGGFVSPHPDFDPDWFENPFDRRMWEVIRDADVVRFDGSDQMLPSVGTGTFWTGMVTFVRNGDAAAAAAEIQTGFPTVSQLPATITPGS